MNRLSKRWLLAGIVVSVLGSFVPSEARAGVEGQWQVNFLAGSRTVSTEVGKTHEEAWANCQRRIAAQPPSATKYSCQTPRYVATVFADPTPTCAAPRPADDVRTQACPAGTTGTWTQTRSYASAAYPTCWTAGEWIPDRPAAGACVQDAPPPPDPPPAGDVVFASPPIADMSELKPGQTLVLHAGVYTTLKLKACSSSAWCTVRAGVDGAAVFGNLNVGPGAWYVSIEGVRFKGSSGSQVNGSFVKLRRVAFEGGPATGNSASLTIGSNNRTPGASDILLEDSWIYGAGGRYKVLVYNAHRVVLRRVVVRHDGGWKYDNQNPQGGFSLYDSRDVACQNCLFVDPAAGLSGFEAALYLVSNGTTSTKQTNVSVAGAVLIGSPNNGLAAEGQSAASYTVSDLVVLGSKQGAVNTNGAAHTLNVTGLTASVDGTAIARWASSGTLRVTNCKILKGTPSSSATLSSCPGGAGAELARIGVDGTLFGDPGFDQVQAAPLWPWPNEERIKEDFDSVRPAFGGKTLSEYARP